eukprot:CAMPEP_0172461080 /NCGR_PEP_ID=MMETSP1065-20121228/39363_1 /TAXON_ID=265537 /ORGANISM="Amphiprora paludosa, Strain CCMP125" /LENGTH=477 /DNA_ID=CAMNT_0013216291 /DNA_START=165 /DNA_END=1598 /DNA_ORIENTATION=+
MPDSTEPEEAKAAVAAPAEKNTKETEENVDDDDDEEDLDESERPTKRSKTRERLSDNEEETAGAAGGTAEDEDMLDDDDDDDEDDDEEEEDEEYKEPLRKSLPQGTVDAADNNNDKASIPQPDGKKQWYVALPGFGEHKRAVSSVKFAPSRLMKKDRPHAAICASSSADGYIKLWNVQDSWTTPPPDGSGKKRYDDTKRDGGDDTDANRKDGHSLEPSVTCGGHTRGINDIAWNPVSPFLASASDDKTVRLWDMVTGDALVEYRGHDSFVFCVDQYQHMIVSGSFDETVKLWDIRSGDCVSTLPAHSDPVTSVSFNRDGTVVCTGSHDGLIRLWDVATGECLKTIYAAGNPPVCSAKFSPNSKYILAGTLMDATLRLWPVARTGSNLCSKTYKSQHHVNVKYSIVADFTYDGNVLTGSETGKVILYDLQSQDVLQVLEAHEDAVLAVSAHDKLPLLASGAMMNDRRVHFWAPKDFSF